MGTADFHWLLDLIGYNCLLQRKQVLFLKGLSFYKEQQCVKLWAKEKKKHLTERQVKN